jgi:hypothetical protein
VGTNLAVPRSGQTFCAVKTFEARKPIANCKRSYAFADNLSSFADPPDVNLRQIDVKMRQT